MLKQTVTDSPVAVRLILERVFVAIGVLAGLAGFSAVLLGSSWWVMAAGMVIAILAITLAARIVVSYAAAVVGVLTWLAALIWFFVPSSTVAGLPTATTVRELAGLLTDAGQVISTEPSPLFPPTSVILVIAGAFGAVALLSEWVLMSRVRSLALGLMWTAIFVAPSLISGANPSGWVFFVMAGCWVFVTWLGTRDEGSAIGWLTVTATAVLALVCALLTPLLLPDVQARSATWGSGPSPVFGSGINPMLELGRNLRRGEATVALTSTTTADSAPYLKVANLRDFDGQTWAPSQQTEFDRFEGRADLTDRVEVEEVQTEITIQSLDANLLPVPYPATEVSGLRGDWQWVRIGNTVRSPRSSTLNQRYTVSHLERTFTAEQLRAAPAILRDDPAASGPVGPDAARAEELVATYLGLPDDIPAVIEETARSVTAGSTNDYDRIETLQNWLRSDFTYSETAPVEEGYDGNGLEVIERFLEERTGYCVHFSSTLAVMARTLGMPSRVAVGYAPGSATSVDADGERIYETSSHALHAWTEVHFDGLGWIPFDPTPGIGTATSSGDPNSLQTPQEDPAEPSLPTQPTPEATESAQPMPQDTEMTDSAFAGSDDSSALWTLVTRGLWVLAAVLLLGLPALLRFARRQRRWRSGADSVEPLWAELQDTAIDLGMGASATETPRAFARRLAESTYDSGELYSLLNRVETSRYGSVAVRESQEVALRETQALVSNLETASSPRSRWRARWWPRSLWTSR